MTGFPVLDYHLFCEGRSCQINRFAFGASIAQLTPPRVEQRPPHITPPCELGDAGAGRKGPVQDLQPLHRRRRCGPENGVI